MSPAVEQQAMNAADFFAWCGRPENRDRHFELEEGRVVEMSRPGERHGFVCFNVSRILGNYVFQRRRGYVLSNDTGLILRREPDTVRGPDLALYDQARHYDELQVGYSDQLPTLTVEVLSPNDKWGKVTRRIAQFLARSVAVVWLVDPEGRSITVYRPSQLPQVFEGDDELSGEPELAGFRCRVADVFFLPGEQDAPQ